MRAGSEIKTKRPDNPGKCRARTLELKQACVLLFQRSDAARGTSREFFPLRFLFFLFRFLYHLTFSSSDEAGEGFESLEPYPTLPLAS